MLTISSEAELILDYDGTVVNTTLPGFAKVQQILEKMDLPSVSEDFLRHHWGMRFNEFSVLICREAGANPERAEEFLSLESELFTGYSLDEKIHQSLSRLKDRGRRLSLMTSRNRDSLLRISAEVGFDLGLFAHTQCPEDWPILKPDGQVFEPFAKRLEAQGKSVAGTIYYGDTVRYDLAAARNSGLPIQFVGVVSGISTVADFRAAGADEIIGFAHLGEHLDSLP